MCIRDSIFPAENPNTARRVTVHTDSTAQPQGLIPGHTAADKYFRVPSRVGIGKNIPQVGGDRRIVRVQRNSCLLYTSRGIPCEFS